MVKIKNYTYPGIFVFFFTVIWSLYEDYKNFIISFQEWHIIIIIITFAIIDFIISIFPVLFLILLRRIFYLWFYPDMYDKELLNAIKSFINSIRELVSEKEYFTSKELRGIQKQIESPKIIFKFIINALIKNYIFIKKVIVDDKNTKLD